MKTKDEVRVDGKPVFYAVLYNSMRQAALNCGYALALHGSMQSDMDLMAMPWTEDAVSADELVKAIDECVGSTVWKDFKWKQAAEKPHGRVVYTIAISGSWHIDLSVMPLRPISPSPSLSDSEIKEKADELYYTTPEMSESDHDYIENQWRIFSDGAKWARSRLSPATSEADTAVGFAEWMSKFNYTQNGTWKKVIRLVDEGGNNWGTRSENLTTSELYNIYTKEKEKT